MKNKSFKKLFITLYLVGVIPFLFIAFLTNNTSPSNLIAKLYIFVTQDLGWDSGLITPYYPITSSFFSIYNFTSGTLLALIAWIFCRSTFSSVYNDTRMINFTIANYLKCIMLFIVPYIFIALLMLCFTGDLSHAIGGFKIFSWSIYLYSLLYMAFIFPAWLFLNILFMYILVELSIYMFNRR